MSKMRDVATDLYQHVLEVGGTISGEHGDGLSRSWFVPQQFGPLYDVFRQIKRIFDRQNILNPGKKVADAPQPVTANLRPVVARQPGARRRASRVGEPAAGVVLFRCSWPGEAATGGLHRADVQRLRALPHAAAGRADVSHLPLRSAGGSHAAGQGQPDAGDPHRTTGPDRPGRRRAEATGRPVRALPSVSSRVPGGGGHPQADGRVQGAVRAHQRAASDRLVPGASGPASALGIASFIRSPIGPLRNRQMRWLMERLLGVAQGRKLPRFAASSFFAGHTAAG